MRLVPRARAIAPSGSKQAVLLPAALFLLLYSTDRHQQRRTAGPGWAGLLQQLGQPGSSLPFICQLHLPVCPPRERAPPGWALPCSAHVAVSLMKLVLQHLPSRPSCIKGIPQRHLLGLLLPTHLLRYYAAISSYKCDRPHPCPACGLSLHLRLAPQLQVASPGPNTWRRQSFIHSFITHALAAKRTRRPPAPPIRL